MTTRVDAIAFTGSRDGQATSRRPRRRHGQVQLEMGGKNALVVVDDGDLNVASIAVHGAFCSAGQKSRRPRASWSPGASPPVRSPRSTRARDALVVGDPRPKATHIGPLVDA